MSRQGSETLRLFLCRLQGLNTFPCGAKDHHQPAGLAVAAPHHAHRALHRRFAAVGRQQKGSFGQFIGIGPKQDFGDGQHQRFPMGSDDAEDPFQGFPRSLLVVPPCQGADQSVEGFDSSTGIRRDQTQAISREDVVQLIDGPDGLPALLADITRQQTDEDKQSQAQKMVLTGLGPGSRGQ